MKSSNIAVKGKLEVILNFLKCLKLHPLAGVFIPTPTQARYSFIQLSELDQPRVNEIAHASNWQQED